MATVETILVEKKAKAWVITIDRTGDSPLRALVATFRDGPFQRRIVADTVRNITNRRLSDFVEIIYPEGDSLPLEFHGLAGKVKSDVA
jgi:hypothetical protein